MTGLISFNRLVASFVQSGIVIGNMTGAAAHSPVISAFLTTFDTHMTPLAIRAHVCVNGFPRFFLERIEIGLGNLFKLRGKIIRMLFHQGLGVCFVICRTEYGFRAVGITHIIVAVYFFVSSASGPPSP